MGIASRKAKRAAEIATQALVPDSAIKAAHSFTSAETGRKYRSGDYIPPHEMSRGYKNSLEGEGSGTVPFEVKAFSINVNLSEPTYTLFTLEPGYAVTKIAFFIEQGFYKKSTNFSIQVTSDKLVEDQNVVLLDYPITKNTTGLMDLANDSDVYSPLHVNNTEDTDWSIYITLTAHTIGFYPHQTPTGLAYIHFWIQPVTTIEYNFDGTLFDEPTKEITIGNIGLGQKVIGAEWWSGSGNFSEYAKGIVVGGTVEVGVSSDPDILLDASDCIFTAPVLEGEGGGGGGGEFILGG